MHLYEILIGIMFHFISMYYIYMNLITPKT